MPCLKGQKTCCKNYKTTYTNQANFFRQRVMSGIVALPNMWRNVFQIGELLKQCQVCLERAHEDCSQGEDYFSCPTVTLMMTLRCNCWQFSRPTRAGYCAD